MYWSKAIFFSILALIAATAGAQVHRCKDATEKLVFSDRPCTAGQTSELIQRERSQEAILQEREQAFNAEARKQDRRISEQEREWTEQQRRALQLQPAPMVRHSGNDWQKRNDLRNAEVSATSITNNGGKWDKRAEAERARERLEEARRNPPPPIPPTNITNCNGGFCQDNQGGTYHRNGPDFMTGPNGQACHRAGNMWHCN
jgi:hypothetical protein